VKYHIPKKNVGIKNPAWCKNDAAKLFIDFQYKLEYKKTEAYRGRTKQCVYTKYVLENKQHAEHQHT
jgi:hypothetical protein